MLLEYRSSSLSKNSRSEIKVKVQNYDDQNSVKGGSMEERHLKKFHSVADLNFFFPSFFVYLLTNWSSQFFSNWKSAEPVFCSEELSCFPCKNQNICLSNFSFGEEKCKFAVLWCLFIKPLFHWATFDKMSFMKVSIIRLSFNVSTTFSNFRMNEYICCGRLLGHWGCP